MRWRGLLDILSPCALARCGSPMASDACLSPVPVVVMVGRSTLPVACALPAFPLDGGDVARRWRARRGDGAMT